MADDLAWFGRVLTHAGRALVVVAAIAAIVAAVIAVARHIVGDDAPSMTATLWACGAGAGGVAALVGTWVASARDRAN